MDDDRKEKELNEAKNKDLTEDEDMTNPKFLKDFVSQVKSQLLMTNQNAKHLLKQRKNEKLEELNTDINSLLNKVQDYAKDLDKTKNKSKIQKNTLNQQKINYLMKHKLYDKITELTQEASKINEEVEEDQKLKYMKAKAPIGKIMQNNQKHFDDVKSRLKPYPPQLNFPEEQPSELGKNFNVFKRHD